MSVVVDTAEGRLQSASWAEDGMVVWIRHRVPGDQIPKVLRCTVEVATGNALRVVNARRGVNRWMPIDLCLVPESDPHARPWRP